MRVAICVVALSLGVSLGAVQMNSADDPDALYAHREDVPNAARAADLWEKTASTRYESAWKLARACYFLGSRGPADARRQQFERGVTAGEGAVRLDSSQPEGHFWLAVD